MLEVAEKCGVAGVYFSHPNGSASEVLYALLLQLYHRGHEGAGMVSFSHLNGIGRPYKNRGRIRDIFKEGEIPRTIGGDVAIGHTRYGTVGQDNPESYLHPISSPNKQFYVAHNGTVTPCEFKNLSTELQAKSTFDTEAIAALFERELADTKDWVKTLESASRYLDGSYTCTILTQEGKLIGIRGPRGLKPLNYGEISQGYAIASETCALESIRAKNITPVQPGELIIIDGDGLRKERFAEAHLSRCSFELIYFSDVTSKFDGTSCWDIRVAAGRRLARKNLVGADYVVPIPDGGRPIAVGFSFESGIPFTEAIRINREVGRVFILPDEQKEEALRRKYLPIRSSIEDKRLVVVDDSIVKADTTGTIVRILREAGVKEVHVRIGYYPIKYPCIGGGVAFADRNKLAMNRFGDIEGIREYIGADSLEFLSPEDLEEIGVKDACFSCGTGNYPFKETQRQLALAESLGYVG